MNRLLRIVLIAVAGIIVITAGAAAIFISQFDPNTLKPRIIEAVKKATGRDLALNGKISLIPSLWTTVRVDDVAFANPPGFSRPQMATIQSLEVQIALLPLLSSAVQIDSLTLRKPDILLETTATGQNNWQLTPEPSPATAPQAPSEPATKTKTAISVEEIRIQDGTIAYLDDATHKLTTLGLPTLKADASSPDSPLHLAVDASYNGNPFSVTADTGGLTRLQDPAATTPWPVKLTVTAAQAKLTADGSLTQPLLGKGYTFNVSGSIPDATALTPFLQGATPPPLHDVTFAAKLADTGGKIPDFSTLTLHIGPSVINGVALDKLDIDAPRLDQPIKIDAAAKLGDAPLTANGTFGPPAQFMPGAKPEPFPVDLTIHAAGATATAKGSVADAHALTGANIAITAQIPDLSALSPLARRPLPALKTIVFQATLTDANGGFQHGAALHGMALTSADGDLSGDAAFGLGARPSLTAGLKSSRIDLDAVQAAIDRTPAAATPAQNANAPPDAKTPPHENRRDDHLFSTQPIPLDMLRTADADVKLDVADLHMSGTDIKAIDTHAVLSNGKLTVTPLAADLPGGHMSGSLSLDAAQQEPPLHLTLHAPGLALKTILEAVHQPSFATGNLEVYADLSGAGDSPHAIAATLDGTFGLAMAGGTIDNRLLGSILGKVMDSLNALDLVGKGGNSELKCFGMRMMAKHGVGAIAPLALSSSLLTMTGAGTINFGPETVAMALKPQAKVAGTGLVIPIAVSGPIRDPSVKVNDLGAAEANAGTVAGVILGNATPLGIVGGLLGADKFLGGGTTDICTPALAAARGQAVPEQKAADKPGIANPEALLKNLFK
jgi:AsmA protein